MSIPLSDRISCLAWSSSEENRVLTLGAETLELLSHDVSRNTLSESSSPKDNREAVEEDSVENSSEFAKRFGGQKASTGFEDSGKLRELIARWKSGRIGKS